MPEVIEVMPVMKRGRKEQYVSLYKFFKDLNYSGEYKGKKYSTGFGQPIRLRKGEDYHCAEASMRASIYRIAAINGCNVTCGFKEGEVYFQAVSLEIMPKVTRKSKHEG